MDWNIGKFFKKISKFSSKIGVISPNNIIIVQWKLFLLVICIIELFKLPLKASFGLIFETGVELYLLHLIPLSFFIIEILMNFNTGFY